MNINLHHKNGTTFLLLIMSLTAFLVSAILMGVKINFHYSKTPSTINMRCENAFLHKVTRPRKGAQKVIFDFGKYREHYNSGIVGDTIKDFVGSKVNFCYDKESKDIYFVGASPWTTQDMLEVEKTISHIKQRNEASLYAPIPFLLASALISFLCLRIMSSEDPNP